MSWKSNYNLKLCNRQCNIRIDDILKYGYYQKHQLKRQISKRRAIIRSNAECVIVSFHIYHVTGTYIIAPVFASSALSVDYNRQFYCIVFITQGVKLPFVAVGE